MSKQGAVHVFIGAPNPRLSHGEDLDENCSTSTDIPTWNEVLYVYNDKKSLCVQENYHKSNILYHESDTLPDSRQICGVHKSNQNSFGFPNLKTDSEDTAITDMLSSVSKGKLCKMTPNHQAHLKNVTHGHLDSTFPKESLLKENKAPESAAMETAMYTEPCTVPTSCWIAPCDFEGIPEQSNVPNNLDNNSIKPKAALFEPYVCNRTAATQSLFQTEMEKCLDGSLELFTPTSDDILCVQTSFSKLMPCQQENVQEFSNISFGEPMNSYNCADSLCKSSKVFQDIASTSSALEKTQTSKISKSDGLHGHLGPNVDDEIFQKWFDSLVPLNCCSGTGKAYNILVVAVHPCHMKEVQVKTGPNAGCSIPLTTIVVLDHTVVERKVVMWRSAAFLTLEVFPGDIIIVTHLILCNDRWNGETTLQSTAKSKLLNLGSCSVLCRESLDVEHTVLKELLKHLSAKHQYLVNLPPRQLKKQDSLPYPELLQVQPETIVHLLIKISDISMLTECSYQYKRQRKNKIILTVEDFTGHTGTIVLWGVCVTWFDQIRLKKDHIWEFNHLFAHGNSISGDVELHSTPWSSYECLFDDDIRAIGFKNKHQQSNNAKHMDLCCLLQEKHCGTILLNAYVTEFFFRVSDHQYIFMNHKTSLSDILAYLPKITFSGCAKCQKELKTDKNSVYEQCLSCLPFNKVKTFYRSALMTIKNKDYETRVHVPSDVLEKMFLNIPASTLNKVVLCSSNVTYGMVIADLCHSILAETGESYILKIRSHFVLDENSVAQEQEFYLLSIFLSL